jgi:hypothetical protein
VTRTDDSLRAIREFTESNREFWSFEGGSCGGFTHLTASIMKMRPNHLTTATAMTLAALLVLSSATQVAAVVVCVGLDGHVDVESVFASCCMPSIARSVDDGSELSITGSTCGDCTDVQLEAPPLRSKETLQLQPDGDAGCSLLCSRCSGAGIAARTAQITGMDLRQQALALLTTVILRTWVSPQPQSWHSASRSAAQGARSSRGTNAPISRCPQPGRTQN